MMTHENQTSPTPSSGPAKARPRLPVVTPRLDIFESAEAYGVAVEMPGVPEEAIEITVERDTLSVSGTAERPAFAGYDLRHAEYPAALYRRELRLGKAVDADKISARLENGLLLVTLPKRPETQPRRITVK